MAKTIKRYFQIHQCQRINSSNLGNPNWLLTGRLFNDDGSWTLEALKTSSNISDSYGEIPNKIYSKMPEIVSAEVELTKANRIKSIRVL